MSGKPKPYRESGRDRSTQYQRCPVNNNLMYPTQQGVEEAAQMKGGDWFACHDCWHYHRTTREVKPHEKVMPKRRQVRSRSLTHRPFEALLAAQYADEEEAS